MTRLLRSSGLAAIVVLASGATPAPGREAPAAAQEPFGIAGGALLWPGAQVPRTADHVAAIGRSGLRSFRTIAAWGLVEPAPPDQGGRHRYDWRTTDATATLLARNGLRWDMILGYSSQWGGALLSSLGPPQVGPFASYAAAVARRYGRRGTFWADHSELPYAPVTNYQVWNEPNNPAFWLPAPDPAAYAALYQATREAVLSVDRNARVATAAIAYSEPGEEGGGSAFLRRMFAARPSLAGNVDALGVTIYSRTPHAVLDQVVAARRALDDLGETRTPIDVNETGWTTSGVVPLTTIEPVTEPVRAQYMTEVVRLLTEADCGIGTITPYAWVTPEDNPIDGAAWFGLADPRTAVVKPSGVAYTAAVVEQLEGAAPARRLACGRPDLPGLAGPRARIRAGFRVSLRRECSRRRMTVQTTLGDEVEPFSRFQIRLPGGAVTTSADPDGGGPSTVRTSRRIRIPRRSGIVSVTAFDDLGRKRATARARLRKCPTPRRY